MTQRKRKPSGTHGSAPAPDDNRTVVLHSLMHLSRTVSVEMEDREIVERFVDALSDAIPGPVFSISLGARGAGGLALFQTSVDSMAPPGAELQVSRSALRRQSIHEKDLDLEGVVISDDESPEEFSVALLDDDRVAGVLSAVYPRGASASTSDRASILEFGLHLQSLLKGARLLRESRSIRDYFFELIDHANAPILVIGRHRKIKVANRAAVALLGGGNEPPGGQLVGQDFLSILPELERPRMIQVIVAALRGESISNFEVRLEKRGGGSARMAINTASLMAPDGEADGVIAIGRDLTEVRELEERVIQAEKLATIGQLAAGVVHELNNPLTSISVYSEYLVKKLTAASHEAGDIEKLRRIHQNTDRILRFTRDLVTYARPSAGIPAYVDLHAVLDQALVFCEHVVSDAGATVIRKYGKGVSEVYAIKAQLHQVFINLITNACHATPEGAGRLTLETRATGDTVTVRLTDNGPGVPVEQRERIFEPFYSTKGEGKGTGLGLSIVRNIVTQHGGSIRVEGEVGRGATFEVVLPARHEES